MEDLHRLVYTSARNKTCSDEEIGKILKSCKKNNVGRDISGILIHTNKRFLQLVEGPKSTILELFEKIKKDSRHGGVNLRFLQPITSRAFPDWYMAYKDLSSDDIGFQTAIDSETNAVIQNMFKGELSGFEDRSLKLLKTFFNNTY